jgi:hypothetical protein
MAEVAIEVGARSDLKVEVLDRDALVALGCGGPARGSTRAASSRRA